MNATLYLDGKRMGRIVAGPRRMPRIVTLPRNVAVFCHSAGDGPRFPLENAVLPRGTAIALPRSMENRDMARWLTVELDPDGQYEWEGF